MTILPYVLLLLATAATPAVEGLKGKATITPDAASHETNITFQADTDVAPVYFVLQHEEEVTLPAKWTGPARLFLADGVLALVAANGTAQLFKFPERGIPESLQGKFQFEVIPTFGIARYERKPPAR